MKKLPFSLACATFLFLWLPASPGQVYLTDASVFSASSSGAYYALDTWVSDPNERFWKTWIQAPDGNFLNGPTQAESQPNILMPLGTTSYRVFLSPGANCSYFAMNLFFNGSTSPGISVFAPMRTSQDPTPFYVNSASFTLDQTGSTSHMIPASGTLTFQSGGTQVTLTDFYLATPSVYGLDLVGRMTTGPDGETDYVAGFTLNVQPIPEPTLSILLFPALGLFASRRILSKK